MFVSLATVKTFPSGLDKVFIFYCQPKSWRNVDLVFLVLQKNCSLQTGTSGSAHPGRAPRVAAATYCCKCICECHSLGIHTMFIPSETHLSLFGHKSWFVSVCLSVSSACMSVCVCLYVFACVFMYLRVHELRISVCTFSSPWSRP